MNQIQPNIKTQVVIIGAGPTGLSLAAQFIRLGVDFIILDKNATTTILSKALVVHARSMEIFKELGISDTAISRGQRIKHLIIIRNGKKAAQVDLGNMGEGLSDFPFVLSLEQSKTEKLLYDFILANNKQVLWQSEFIGMEQHSDFVLATYTDAQGIQHTIEAKYLVGCDGAHSPVRHQLGLTFEGDTEPKLFYVADVMVSSPVVNEKEFYFLLSKDSLVLFFGMEGEGHYRIIGVIPPSMQSNKAIEFNDICDFIKKEADCELEFTKLIWFSTYKVSSRKANAFFAQRCFICGDAGHIHTPAGGQGMNTGIQDAYNLAWKLAMVLKGEAKNEILDSYSRERVENAEHLIKTTDRLFDLMAGTNFFLDFFRQHIFPFVANELSGTQLAKRKMFPLLSQIGIAYPHSSLTVKSSIGDLHAGDRMPYYKIQGKSIYDYLTKPVFKILAFGKKQIENKSSKSGVPCEFYSFDETPAELPHSQKEMYILLRPDNHISYIGSDIDSCYKFLDNISG